MNGDYDELIRKHFKFLEEKFGFDFDADKNFYWRDDLCIFITFELPIPVIEFWLLTEPEFTKLNFLWFLQAYEKSSELRVDKKRYVEESFVYYANLLEKNLDVLLVNLPNLLVPALKLFIQRSMVDYKLSVIQLLSIKGYKLILDYVKTKDPNWIL